MPFPPPFNPSDAGARCPASYAGLDLLACAVVLLDREQHIVWVNSAAENLFSVSNKQLCGRSWTHLLGDAPGLAAAIDRALHDHWSYTGHALELVRPSISSGFSAAPHGGASILHLDCTLTPVDAAPACLLLEFRHIDQQRRAAREEEHLRQQSVNRELLRNLAHEIKNPLGGIRGSAQLLERELANPALAEYTQVIIQEADRLQNLMSRMLSSNRLMHPAPVCIHEILEHVMRLVLAEFPAIHIRRDYDTSLPDLSADWDSLTQATLNIVRNAAQALEGEGDIVFRTRPARQVTIAKRRHRLALEVQIIDNGPGIPESLQDKIFYPLVSGREGGTGLGLMLAQSFISQHQGSIEVASVPGHTAFTLLLPLPEKGSMQ